jgi:hypothetical protein
VGAAAQPFMFYATIIFLLSFKVNRPIVDPYATDDGAHKASKNAKICLDLQQLAGCGDLIMFHV